MPRNCVIGILRNPVRDDPLSAIIYRALGDTRRILNMSSERYGNFYFNLKGVIGTYVENIFGPANGLVDFLTHCSAEVKLDGTSITIHNEALCEPINLTGGSKAHFKRSIKDMLTWQLLSTLAIATI